MTQSLKPIVFLLAGLTLTAGTALGDHGNSTRTTGVLRPEKILSPLLPPASAGTKKKAQCDDDTDNGLTTKEEKAVIADGMKCEMTHFEQDGAKCGLFALKMVMHFHHRRNRSNPSPPVNQAGEPMSDHWQSLYSFATENDYLWDADGETNHWGLADIADGYGYSTKSRSSAFLGGLGAPTLSDLREELDEGRPVLVSVRGTNSKGMPCLNDEKGGHWVVIEGYAEYEGRDYFIVDHGTSGGKHSVWPAEMFEASWKQNWRGTVYLEPPH